ncbi:MAG: hypothetical protein ABFD08_17330 [Syntrophomonas sp.]
MNVFSKRLQKKVIIIFILSFVMLITMLGYAVPEMAGSLTNDKSAQSLNLIVPTWLLAVANDYNVSVISQAAHLYYYSNNSDLPSSIADLVNRGLLESIPRQPFNPDQYYSIQSYGKTIVIIPGKCVDGKPQLEGSTYHF